MTCYYHTILALILATPANFVAGSSASGRFLGEQITFRLKGVTGEESVTIEAGSSTTTRTLTTEWEEYTFARPLELFIRFNNNGQSRDVRFEAVDPTPQNTVIMYPENWAGWNCGHTNENTRCNKVRAGNLNWGGKYIVAFKEFRFRLKGDSGEESVTIEAGSTTITTTLMTEWVEYTFAPPSELFISFHNDNGPPRDVRFEAVDPALQNTVIKNSDTWAEWNCGQTNESERCSNVRDGNFAWNGKYVVSSKQITFRLKGDTGEEEVTIEAGSSRITKTLTTEWEEYTFEKPHALFITFHNDNRRSRDVRFEAVDPTPQNTVIQLIDTWAEWNCGQTNVVENEHQWRNIARAGNFARGGRYVVTFDSAAPLATMASTSQEYTLV